MTFVKTCTIIRGTNQMWSRIYLTVYSSCHLYNVECGWGEAISIEEEYNYPIILNNMLCYANSLQSCPTLCDPTDGSPPGSPVPGVLQARTLEWAAISFSNAWKWKVKVKLLSRVRLLATPWTAAYQAPPSMGFSRQEYWSGVPLLSLILV